LERKKTRKTYGDYGVNYLSIYGGKKEKKKKEQGIIFYVHFFQKKKRSFV
jgi:hypothetical protein